MSEKHRFSDVFRGYKNVTLDINGLIPAPRIVENNVNNNDAILFSTKNDKQLTQPPQLKVL